MAEPTYDEVLKASLNSKLLLYRQLISSFMIKFLCNVEANVLSTKCLPENPESRFCLTSAAVFTTHLGINKPGHERNDHGART